MPHPSTERRVPTQGHIRIIGLTVLVLSLLSDLVTKSWALSQLADGRRIPIIGDYLSLVLVHNSGAAFSLGNNATLVVTIVGSIVSVALAVAMWRSTHLLKAVILASILGGALGNIHDRFFSAPYYGYGHVVDFIDYGGYFVGNVADIWIVVGVAALVITSLREDPSHG